MDCLFRRGAAGAVGVGEGTAQKRIHLSVAGHGQPDVDQITRTVSHSARLRLDDPHQRPGDVEGGLILASFFGTGTAGQPIIDGVATTGHGRRQREGESGVAPAQGECGGVARRRDGQLPRHGRQYAGLHGVARGVDLVVQQHGDSRQLLAEPQGVEVDPSLAGRVVDAVEDQAAISESRRQREGQADGNGTQGEPLCLGHAAQAHQGIEVRRGSRQVVGHG